MNRIEKARLELILADSAFGALSMGLTIVEQEGTGAAATDGRALYFDPEVTKSWTDAEMVGLVLHEVLHCGMRHMMRRDSRDGGVWNRACDAVVNAAIARDGRFRLHKSAGFHPSAETMPAEGVYAVMQREKPQEAAGDGKGDGFGEDLIEVPTQAEAEAIAEDWRIAVEQSAAIGRKAGDVGGMQARLVEESRRETVDWRAVLREFIQRTVPTDTTWAVPNRRLIGQGLYLPGPLKENAGRVAVLIDVSESVDVELLADFMAEVSAIAAEFRPDPLHLLAVDTDVRSEVEIGPGEEIDFTPIGGGGTQLRLDVFTDETVPDVAVYFTDLCASDPIMPDFPVLWVTPHDARSAPFGEQVRM